MQVGERRQLGESAAHQPAGVDGVGDARRDAHVVLEHEPPAVVVPHDVEAADLNAALLGGRRRARLPIAGARGEEGGGQDAVADDAALAVDVVEERVEGARPLRAAALQAAPSSPLTMRGTKSIGKALAARCPLARNATPAAALSRSRTARRSLNAEGDIANSVSRTVAWAGRGRPVGSRASS